MQTFLPYSDFNRSAKCLDNRRLFKQLVEAKQILCTLRYPTVPEKWVKTKSWENQRWKNHPAVKMWEGYEYYLGRYYNSVLEEVLNRGINTGMEHITNNVVVPLESPWWLYDDDFLDAMKARLYCKDPVYYKEFEKYKEFNGGKYLWPDNKNKEYKII